jgi:hypothetical protein
MIKRRHEETRSYDGTLPEGVIKLISRAANTLYHTHAEVHMAAHLFTSLHLAKNIKIIKYDKMKNRFNPGCRDQIVSLPKIGFSLPALSAVQLVKSADRSDSQSVNKQDMFSSTNNEIRS